ncbi:MAG TPA: tail fiber protein [Bryobacteraceae bacterium]|jgi:microcystin-dependent protein
MSSPFLGEIRMAGFNFPPRTWAFCNGQILSISQNTALFSLLGTYYGGNGTSNFALPNLQSRIPLGVGQAPGLSDYVLGEMGGLENVTLLSTEMPNHNHGGALGVGIGSSRSNLNVANGNVPAGASRTQPFSTAAPGTPMASPNPTGGGQPHTNQQPYLALNFIIAMAGIFPARN